MCKSLLFLSTIGATLLTLALVTFCPPVGAQSAGAYPQKPIHIVVPFPAGGYSDSLARLVGKDMASDFGQPVIVDNRPGAGGNIGADIVAKSAPDGYTLVMGTIGTHAINSALYKHIPYDGIKDFAPVAFIADAETVLVVNPQVPVRTVPALIALAKAKPGELTFASAGAGSTSHLAGELFQASTGTTMVHVPYKGNAPAMTDLVGGQVALSFATLQTALPFIKSGKLIALATLGAARSAALPNVPTLDEAGLHGFQVRNWTGLLAPARTPDAFVQKLATEVDKIMESPAVQSWLARGGLSYTKMGPAMFAAFIKSETDKWTKIVEAAGVHAD
ncbi:MAG: tripartite tricarboxylate transporter substrate binding protein [Caldimonas sp.]